MCSGRTGVFRPRRLATNHQPTGGKAKRDGAEMYMFYGGIFIRVTLGVRNEQSREQAPVLYLGFYVVHVTRLCTT
jgi:hypothetical protein